MKNYIKDGYKNKIIINSNDENLIDATRKFLMDLEKLKVNFDEKIKIASEDFEDFKRINKDSNTKTKFTPEILTRKSPMTVIDAKWGTGKTYFVERLIMNMVSREEIKNETSFQNAILIDAWKVSNADDVVSEVFAEIINAIDEISDRAFTAHLKNFAKWTFDTAKSVWKNKIGIDSADVNVNQYEESLKKIKSPNGTTIIFVDNIERVGKEAWEIIKGISRLLILEGFVIILPINLEKMHKIYNETDVSNETAIEKYLDIKYFEFEQDYIGLLKNCGIPLKEAEYYNESLNEVENGTALSIREVKHRIENSGILHIKNSENRKILFYKNLWRNENGFKDEMKKIYINNIEKVNNLNSEINKIWNNISLNLNILEAQGEVTRKIKLFNTAKADLTLADLGIIKNIFKNRINKYAEMLLYLEQSNSDTKEKISNAKLEREKISSKIIYCENEIDEFIRVQKEHENNKNRIHEITDEESNYNDEYYDEDDLKPELKKELTKLRKRNEFLEKKYRNKSMSDAKEKLSSQESKLKLVKQRISLFEKSIFININQMKSVKSLEEEIRILNRKISKDFKENEILKLIMSTNGLSSERLPLRKGVSESQIDNIIKELRK